MNVAIWFHHVMAADTKLACWRPISSPPFSSRVNLLHTCWAIYSSFRLIEINRPPLTASTAVCKRINSAEMMINTSSLRRRDLRVSGKKNLLHSGAHRMFIGEKSRRRWQWLLAPLFLGAAQISLERLRRDEPVVLPPTFLLASSLAQTTTHNWGLMSD